MISYPKPTKQPKKKKKVTKKPELRGLSDGHLLKLHREAIRKLFNYRCFHCNLQATEMEAHHLVKRKNFLLRYNWRNGILLCKYVCHAWAETPEGKHRIDKHIELHRDYLQARSGAAKQWLTERGMTKNDYRIEMKKELEEILK